MMTILTELFPEEAAPVITRLSRDTKKDPFIILVGTLLSLRTKDETTEKVMGALMPRIKSPQDLIDIPLAELEKLIYPVGFYRNKAKGLKEVAAEILHSHGGTVPDTIDELMKIRGVGRKTANLVVTEGYGKPGICVDTHVHRISNRLGIVSTKNPHQTEEELTKKTAPAVLDNIQCAPRHLRKTDLYPVVPEMQSMPHRKHLRKKRCAPVEMIRTRDIAKR